MKQKYSKGLSLVEVLVSVGVVILLVTGLVAGMTSALRTTQVSRNRSLANKLSQEGMEQVRSLRDSSWVEFQSVGTTGTAIYCLGDSAPSWASPVVSGNDCTEFTQSVGGYTQQFRRWVSFSWQPGPPTPARMVVVVTTSWTERVNASGTPIISTVPLTTTYTDWR